MPANLDNRYRYIPANTGADSKPYGIWDRDRQRMVASYADSRDMREALVSFYGWTPAQARRLDTDSILADAPTVEPAAPIEAPTANPQAPTVTVDREQSVSVEWFDTVTGAWFDMGAADSLDAARWRIGGLLASDGADRMGARYRIVTTAVETYNPAKSS